MQKQMPQYRTLLRDAWQLTKSHNQLWVWGFFAGLLGGFGEYEIVGKIVKSIGIASSEVVLNDSVFSSLSLRFFGSLALLKNVLFQTASVPPLLLLLTVLFAVGGLLLLWLSFTGVIAIVVETRRLLRRAKISLTDGFASSQKHLFAVVFTYAIGRVLITIVGSLLLLFGVIVLLDVWLGLPLLLTGFIVLVPLLFAIIFVARFTIIGIVGKSQTIYDAIVDAVELVKKHWLVTLEVALMLVIIASVVGIIAVLIIAITALPALLTSAFFINAGFPVLGQLFLLLSVILLVTPLIIAATFIGVYQWVTWTLLYSAISKRDSLRSKIIRLAENIVPHRVYKLKRK